MKLSQLRSLIKQEVRRTMNESNLKENDDFVERAIERYDQLNSKLTTELKKIVDHPHADLAILAWQASHPAFDHNDQMGSLDVTLSGCKLWVQNGKLMLRDSHGVDYKYNRDSGSYTYSWGGWIYGDWYPILGPEEFR